MAMFLSHYPDLKRELLGEGWAPGMRTTVTPRSQWGVLSSPGR
jgi:hypothetical protein